MRGICVSLSISLVLLISAQSRADDAVPPAPKAMAVLGDSMSEGMLAGYSLEKKPGIGMISDLLWIASTSEDQNERITQYRKKWARKDLSWASGYGQNDLVESHFERLKKLNPDLVGVNFAVSGAATPELSDQLNALKETEAKRRESFDYLILMMGANDLGALSNEEIVSPLVYIGNIEAALRELLLRDPNRRILLVGLPDIHTIFEESANIPVYSLWGESVDCKAMRKAAYGRRTIFFPENAEDYAYTKTTIHQYRDGLKGLAERLQEDFPQAQIRNIYQMRNPTNTKKALSIDCFHPSEWGQAELAEATWEQGFWGRVQNVDGFDTW